MEAKHEACSDDNGLQGGEGLGTGGKLLCSRGEDPRAVRGTDQQLPGCGARKCARNGLALGLWKNCSHRPSQVWLRFAGHHWASLDDTGQLWVSLGFTRYHWASLDTTGLYWASLHITGSYWPSLDITGLSWASGYLWTSLCITGHLHHMTSLDITGHHYISLGFTGHHWMSLGITGHHWALVGIWTSLGTTRHH